jgi:hypothetical protein
MRPVSRRGIAFGLAVLLFLTLSTAVSSQQPSGHPATPDEKADAGQAQSIVLPQFPGEIAAGPNVSTYRRDCLLCHTSRYVSMQPRFSKTVWQNEVKKMVDAYGAPISVADQARIVEYLVAIKGVVPPGTASAPPK